MESMSYLLHITVSPSGDHSTSRNVGAKFLEAFQAKNPSISVKTRDLNANPLPHLDGEAITAGYTPENKRSPSMDRKFKARLELIEELVNAHSILVTTPMWNWNVPSGLKAYIDQIIIPGVNDSYTKKLAGKSVTIVMATGGSYGPDSPNAAAEFEGSYLEYLFTALGSRDVDVIRSEMSLAGVAQGMDKYIEAKEKSFAAAVAAAIARANGKAAVFVPRKHVSVPKNTTMSAVNRATSGYLLHITISPSGENSYSRKVGNSFIKAFLAQNDNMTVRTLDLNTEILPHLDAEAIFGTFTGEKRHLPGMISKYNKRLALVEELSNAHSILVTTPMWNWNVPSGLKAYIDQIIIPGVNDNHTKKLARKSVTIVMATGGYYGPGSFKADGDFESGYLHHVFKTLGSTDVDVIRSEWTLAGVTPGVENHIEDKEKSFAAALASAAARAKITVLPPVVETTPTETVITATTNNNNTTTVSSNNAAKSSFCVIS